jgi:para-nitrobenzyl esterase
VAGTSHIAAIAAQYAQSSTYPAPRDQVAAAMTDGTFACPTRRAARAFAAQGQSAFLYQFTYPFSVTLVPGAVTAHGFELPFVFGNALYGTGLRDKDQPMATTIAGYWSAFASTGTPTGPSMWPRYATSSDENLVIDATLSTTSGTKKDVCDFWDSLE